MKILVIGGAGYIGSNMVHLLVNSGFEVVVLDDLSCGHRDAVHNATLIVGSTDDGSLLDSIFSQHQISAVMHFASSIQVGESVLRPDLYYVNNLSNTIILLNAMMRANVKHLIFSSTAAVYGDPHYTPIDEGHPKLPLNPYGRTKWMAEQVLQDFDRAFGLRYTSLRYFNAAGANISASLGERHEPETHLIPLVLQAASGRRNSISVFGSDYETRDGTCVRDYIHIQDLCRAHLLALKRLSTGAPSAQYNLGNGEGFTVQEVINSAKRVTARHIEVQYLPRREGDPATLVADSKLAKMELGWTPQYSDLNTIIQDAWAWELSYPWGRSS
ncbi:MULTISPECIES: UDP-glucose 4-epimerase GalE [Pseudomonas]|uniref:UDP-glucose 4-epimerase GalE n=1 Tax=Pseudomonas TaxID=286 RepID=UPI000CC53FDF|nr:MULTISPECIES: UDP-glucose 4-epimerase GalE [Pseudomonas]EKT4504253.1 UDP-glucose 4-epimerase GalE [Pseudomonas putida]PKF25727.1 UDP-glucose 4-epimerase GalE [Pseudomonas hunanensis]QNG08297.1 UDP-glucose 4-epimerase GalE [Pseudomonas putida]HDS1059452.1 UDP-glucose 4-epimerase GalE [Pseudomonas putida]